MIIPSASGRRRSGYVLIAVLIVIVVLSLIAYQFCDLMTSEYKSAVRTSESIQARSNAISGIHYTIAMLSDTTTFNSTLAGNPFNNNQFFKNITVQPNPNSPRKEGRFSIIAVINNGTAAGPVYANQYGVTDEGGKININALIQSDPTGQVLYNILMQLPNMTDQIACSIVDWVDPDDILYGSGSGAENSSGYYAGLNPPYQCKNGALNTLDELLLVQGVTPQLLYGTDRNRNGVGDDDPSSSGLQVDRGWSDYLTVYGRELNISSAGTIREYLNDSEDMNGLYQRLITKVGQEMADYIMAYKLFGGTIIPTATTGSSSTSGSSTTGTTTGSGTSTGTTSGSTAKTGTMSVTVSGTSGTASGSLTVTATPGVGATSNTVAATPAQLTTAVTNSLTNGGANKKVIKSVMDLVSSQVTLPTPAGSGPNAGTLVYLSPLVDPGQQAQYLPILMDQTTATQALEMIPRLNLMTAPAEAISGLPGLAASDVQNLITIRSSLVATDPGTTSGAWVITQGGINPLVYKAIEPYVTSKTMIYRIHSLGYFGEGGPVARVEAVIDTNQGAPRILSFRDMTDLDNPRGFAPPRDN